MPAQIVIGKSYRIHPASDWFMRGATWAEVLSVKGSTAIVQLFNGLGRIDSPPVRIAIRDLEG